MPINIKVNTGTAVKSVLTLNRRLKQVADKARLIKEAFAQLDLTKLKEAKTALMGISKIKNDYDKQLSGLQKIITAQKDQNKELTKLNTSLKEVAKSSKKSAGADKEASESKRQLTILEKKSAEAQARTLNITKKHIDETRKYIGTMEREKIITAEVTAAQRQQLLVGETHLRNEIKLIAENKLAVDTYRQYAESLAQLTVAKGKLNGKTAVEIELVRLQAEARKRANDITARTIFLNSKLSLELSREEAIQENLIRSAKASVTAQRSAAQADRDRSKSVKNTTSSISAATAKNREFSSSLNDGNRHAAEFRAAMSALGLSFGIFTGSTIVMAATVYALVRAIRATIEAGAEFEFTMDRVNAVMNTTRAGGMALEKEVRSLAETTIFTAGEVSKGLVFLGMAGFQTGEALQALRPTLRLAQIGMIDMERAADLVTNIMAGFDIKASEVAETVDKLSIVVTSSNTSITQLAQALSFVGPAAANTNTSLEETTAIIGFFGNVGIKATRAGTSLRRGIANLSNPSKKVSERMTELGITITATDGRMRSMADIMEDLSTKGATMSDIFEIFGTRAGPAFASAIIRGTDEIQALVEAQEGAIGTSEALAAILADNAYTDFKLVISAAHEALISFYETMDGPLRNALKGFKNFLKAISPYMGAFATILGVAMVAVTSLGIAMALVGLAKWAAGITLVRIALIAFSKQVVATTLVTSYFGAALIFLTGPIGLISIALGALGLAYIYAESEADKLTKTLREQKKIIDDMAELRLEIGLEKLDGDEGILDKMIARLKELEGGKEQTVGERISKSMKEAGDEVTRLTNLISRLNAKLDAPSRRGQQSGDKAKWREGLVIAADNLEIAKARQMVIKQTLVDLLKMQKTIGQNGHAEGENYLLKLKSADVQKLINEHYAALQDHLDVISEIERSELTYQAKQKAIAEEYLKIEKAITGQKKTQSALTEEITKKSLKRDFKSLKSNVGLGDDSEILLRIEKSFEIRKNNMAGLLSTAQDLVKDRKALVKLFKDSSKQKDQLEASLGKDTFAAIERYYTDYRKLVIKYNDDILELAGILTTNRVKEEHRAWKEIEGIQQSARDRLRDSEVRDFERQKATMDRNFNSRLVSLRDYAKNSMEIDKDIAGSKIKNLKDTIASLDEYSENIRKDIAIHITDGDVIAQLNIHLLANITLRTKLAGKIRDIRNEREANATVDERILDISKSWVDAANEQVDAMERELLKLRLGSDAVRDLVLVKMDLQITTLRNTQASGDFSIVLQKEIEALVDAREAYSTLRDKVAGLSDDWDSAANNMKGKAKSAAMSMQDAFAEFLFEPTKKGFDDLLSSFIDMIRKMVAENLAKQIFNSGLGNVLTSFFAVLGSSGTSSASAEWLSSQGTSTGYSGGGGKTAVGGSWKVGGSGGIDSQLVQFMATPGENVTVSNPNGGDDLKLKNMTGNSTVFNNTINIHADTSNKAEVRAMIDQGLTTLESRIARNQQRSQKAMGLR